MVSDGDGLLFYCVIMHKRGALRSRPLLFITGDLRRFQMLTLESPEPALQTLVLPPKLALDVN